VTNQPAPAGLGPRAIELWQGVVSRWDLRIDELLVLEAACHEVDLLDAIMERQKTEDLIGTGSQGQPVAAPLVSEMRMHRATLANLLKQLKLPDTDDGRATATTSDLARRAANARWRRSG
jgi:hypothetical protein